MIFISVVCPIYNEEKYIARCIESIVGQDYPREYLEVIFVDGMSNDKTRDIVAVFQQKYPGIRLLDNPYKIVPHAMNIGIKAAKGEIIVRLDAHAIYPDDYLKQLVAGMEKFRADNVGGICETLPANDSAPAIAIACALSCKFGMGNSHFRTGTQKAREVDTVPFGCFRRSLFDKIGFYDVDLIRNQDDELNARIIQNGGRIFLIPDIRVQYFTRDKLSKVRKMFYQYGLYKPLVNKKLGKPATVRQFFPLAFVIGLLGGAILSLVWPPFFFVYISVLILYSALGISIGIDKGIRFRKPSLVFWMPVTFFTIHSSYGLGYLHGIVKILTGRKFDAQVNH